MYPFERDLLLEQIRRETLGDANVPEQGWSKYAEEIGATKRGRYTDKFTALPY